MKDKMRSRTLLLIMADIFATFASIYFGVVLRLNSFDVSLYYTSILQNIVSYFIIIFIIYYFLGLYRSLWRYASVEELVKLIFASFSAIVLLFICNLICKHSMPNSVFAIAFLVQVGISGGFRFSYRVLRVLRSSFRSKTYIDKYEHRIIIIGSGYDAAAIIKQHSENNDNGVIVGIVDRYHKVGTYIGNVKVQGPLKDLEEIISLYTANEVIIASEFFTEEDVTYTLGICSKLKCKLRKSADTNDVNTKNMIVDINPEDLLGRPKIVLDKQQVQLFLKDEVVFVTGGGGSIGSELVKQIANYGPTHIIIIDIFENFAYLTKLTVERNFPNIRVDMIVASIRDKKRMGEIFKLYKPSIVFHAAAHKHVPLMEVSPNEALKNNILGTYNVSKCADKYKVKKFVLISTDKAVNPTNVMGATKRVGEIIINAFNNQSETDYSAVRFGNVLGSSGSVIPIFNQQIKEGGPVTVTHPDITRYFMTIPEACQLVLQAGAMANGGEIFILDMQSPVKIKDLAENLIRLHNLIPYVDIDIKFTGLRPGEKLYEELLHSGESLKTKHDKIFISKTKEHTIKEIDVFLLSVKKSIKEDYILSDVISLLQELVPEFQTPDIDKINKQLKSE